MKRDLLAFSYKYLLKPLLFSFDAELVHNLMTKGGVVLGSNTFGKNLVRRTFAFSHKSLGSKTLKLQFNNPVGLSAGFDYNAELTAIMPEVGFGFMSVGTITNQAYGGNPRPILGRLPKSRSLLVNKGFKNEGTDMVIERLKNIKFSIPVGISVGRSNSANLLNLSDSIKDIRQSFTKLVRARLANAYWELNISCPNLIHGSKDITFYPPQNLNKLLAEIDKLKLKKPLLIKMPISVSDADFVKMLKIMKKHKVDGVIIGNLQKDRKNGALDKAEVAAAKEGNFSGAPCFKRSNELISLAFNELKGKIMIVGCGGIFNANDAYEKIRRGANLVMLITGMIFEGPQVIGKINEDLVYLLKRDGYESVSDAVGSLYLS